MKTLYPLLAAWLALQAPVDTASAQAGSFRLAPSGCAMAHCDSQLSNTSNGISPASGTLVAIDSATLGAKGGIGCVANGSLAACSFGGDPSAQANLVVYDADGRRLWDDQGQLGTTAWTSAPMLGSDGSVIAADQQWLLRADPLARQLRWKVRKPDAGLPISPVLVGASTSMILLATSNDGSGAPAELSVWDAETGALLSHQVLADAQTGRSYITRNTPAVRGNRAYISTSATGDDSDGRLYAIEVCESATCGGRGAVSVRWFYEFKGPSGSSPLLIGNRLFFDGQGPMGSGSFIAVDDADGAPRLAWKRLFNAKFVANAAQDPRGGIWVYPFRSTALLRLNMATGAIDQQVLPSSALGLPAGYAPSSCLTVSSDRHGAVVLSLGLAAFGNSGLPTYVAAIDVGSSAAGRGLWSFAMAPNWTSNGATGQFPIVTSGSGARRIVFTGSLASTFFVGEP